MWIGVQSATPSFSPASDWNETAIADLLGFRPTPISTTLTNIETAFEYLSMTRRGPALDADPVMPENLDQIVFAAAEHPEIAGVRIMLQALLNLQGQPAHAPPQVAVAGCNPDLDTARNRDHRASNRSVVDTSASGAFAMICTRARPISTTIAAAGTAGGVDVKLSR